MQAASLNDLKLGALVIRLSIPPGRIEKTNEWALASQEGASTGDSR
jgi:hypothetical protein